MRPLLSLISRTTAANSSGVHAVERQSVVSAVYVHVDVCIYDWGRTEM